MICLKQRNKRGVNMDIHAISKGVVIYFALLFISIATLNFTEFALTERTFTFYLVLGMFIIGIYTGKKSYDNAGLNGFLIGLVTSLFLIFCISAYTEVNWELNFMIIVVWMGISVTGAFVGGKLNAFGKKVAN